MPCLQKVLVLITVFLSLSSYALPVNPPPVVKQAAAVSANSCSLPPRKVTTPNVATKAKRALDEVLNVSARDQSEFVGFHGTNSHTATFWEAQKFISKPPPPANSFWDFVGGLFGATTGGSGSSGADAELGPGLYVTDDADISLAFANNNAKVNPGTTPKLCAIYATHSGNWRNVINKVFLPEGSGLVGDSQDAAKAAAFEKARQTYIKLALDSQPSTTVRFSVLNRKTKTGQMVLPDSITAQFSAQCFDFDGQTLPPGMHAFPAFSYNSGALRTDWRITPENEAAAKCAVG